MSGHLCAEMMQDDSSLYPLLDICTGAYSTLGNRCCHKSPTSYTVCNIRLAQHCPQHLLVLIQSMDTFLVGHLEVQLYGHFFFGPQAEWKRCPLHYQEVRLVQGIGGGCLHTGMRGSTIKDGAGWQ